MGTYEWLQNKQQRLWGGNTTLVVDNSDTFFIYLSEGLTVAFED
jgi:hypothetical protein